MPTPSSVNEEHPQVAELTKNEADQATCQVDETAEEVDDKIEDFGDELEGELCGFLHKGGCGCEEGPDQLDDGSEEICDSFDYGRHGWC